MGKENRVRWSDPLLVSTKVGMGELDGCFDICFAVSLPMSSHVTD